MQSDGPDGLGFRDRHPALPLPWVRSLIVHRRQLLVFSDTLTPLFIK